MNMTGYQYSPLENDEIRLLILHAGTGNTPIRASLYHALLGCKNIAYDALSYCWGNRTTDYIISLNNCNFEVSENLGSALRHLRQPSADRILWVDAICINQKDLDERSRQVLRMGTIYHRAAAVRAWLGPTAEYSDFAMTHLQNASADSFKGGLRGGGLSNISGAIIALITRPWFRRRWVIQEVAFAKTVILHCGYDTLPWSTFSDVIKAMNTDVHRNSIFFDLEPKVIYQNRLEHSSSVYNGDPDAQSASALIFAAEHVLGEKLQASTSQIARLWDLETLVERFGSFFVSDKRDAIYALFSLASDMYLSTEWIPDYKKDIQEIYKDFVTYSIQSTGNLDILVRPWAPERRDWGQPRLPCWISCYWGPTSVTGDGGGRIRELVVPLVGTANKRNYAASGSSRVVLGLGVKFLGKALRVHGICLDTVVEWHDNLVEWDMGLSQGQKRSEKFRNVLFNADQAHHSLATKFSIRTGRSYFLSTTGLMGLGPSIIEVGDMICIFFGCSVPVILRKEENDYILVGESYVDDFMHGEAMKEFEKGTYPLQEFCLV